MNVMEAFDRCIVKRSSSPTVIKMEAAERPFESANTVADSGVIVKREKLSPIRIVSIRLLYRKMYSRRLDLRFIFIVIILS
jgi:hypothetical protein